MRDPHIYRSPIDGSFLLCATDLHIYAQDLGLRDSLWERPKEDFGWGNNKAIVLMRSNNLVNWTHTTLQFDSLYPEEWSDIGCAWAPETFYDDIEGRLMVTLTMRHRTQPDRQQYIYVDSSYTQALTAPAQLFDYPPSSCSVIDGSLAKVDSMYVLSYCVHDREGGGPGIKMATSTVSPRGPWTYIDRWVDFEPRSCEAPNVWKRIGEREWVLVYDIFSIKPHNLGFVSTTDFENFNYLKHFNRGVMKTTNFSSPKHPAVIQITAAEADALEKYWGENPRKYSKPLPDSRGATVELRSRVFAGPDSISKFYRIPALATLPDGTIVALADRRLESNGDLPGKIDVVCRRSTDGGKSWSDVIDVAVHDKDGGYGDPALGVAGNGDLVAVFTHGNGLWQSVRGNHASIYTSRSNDGGLTWTAPADITSGLFSQTPGEAPVTAIAAFASSGHILTGGDGTMWFVLVARPDEEPYGPLHAVVCRSTDNGLSWRSLPTPADTYADESKLVELPDGRLLMSIRNRLKGYRKFTYSSDRGLSWSEPVVSTTLPDPACNGEILALPDGRLIHSINNSHTDREKITLFTSDDLGTTWQPFYEVCPGGGAYSTLTLIDSHTLGILTEEQAPSHDSGLHLWFTRLKLTR